MADFRSENCYSYPCDAETPSGPVRVAVVVDYWWAEVEHYFSAAVVAGWVKGFPERRDYTLGYLYDLTGARVLVVRLRKGHWSSRATIRVGAVIVFERCPSVRADKDLRVGMAPEIHDDPAEAPPFALSGLELRVNAVLGCL